MKITMYIVLVIVAALQSGTTTSTRQITDGMSWRSKMGLSSFTHATPAGCSPSTATCGKSPNGTVITAWTWASYDAAGNLFSDRSLDSSIANMQLRKSGFYAEPELPGNPAVHPEPSDTPVPVTVWLFAAGLIALAGLKRKRT